MARIDEYISGGIVGQDFLEGADGVGGLGGARFGGGSANEFRFECRGCMGGVPPLQPLEIRVSSATCGG